MSETIPVVAFFGRSILRTAETVLAVVVLLTTGFAA